MADDLDRQAARAVARDGDVDGRAGRVLPRVGQALLDNAVGGASERLGQEPGLRDIDMRLKPHLRRAGLLEERGKLG